MGVKWIGGASFANADDASAGGRAIVGAQGVTYVPQDNFLVVGLEGSAGRLYCDSATSCVIIVVTGKSASPASPGAPIAAITHLSRPGRFSHFFSLVGSHFRGEISVYAAGANPPFPIPGKSGLDRTALRNAMQTAQWINDASVLRPEQKFSYAVQQAGVRFGEGDPSRPDNNLDCLGIDLPSLEITNRRENLGLDDRDSTGGLQTLFCIFGPEDAVRNAASGFSDRESGELAAAAKGFDRAADMSDADILATYSSTPEYEVPWFCETLRQAGQYVKDHA